jgi:hypothetical protein
LVYHTKTNFKHAILPDTAEYVAVELGCEVIVPPLWVRYVDEKRTLGKGYGLG